MKASSSWHTGWRRADRRRAPTPADLVVLCLLAAAVPLSRAASGNGRGGGSLLVQSAGQAERRFDARRDFDLEIAGPAGRTLLRVRSGRAWIAAAPCRNRLCQRLGRIAGPGRSLVCVPNRVLVRFAGAESGVDAITR